MPKAGSRNLWKTLFFADSTALFKVFSGSGGSKINEKPVRKQHPAESGLQERLGRLLGSIFEPFGCHFGTQNRPEGGPKTSWILERFLGGPRGDESLGRRLRPATAGPPGRGRGGVVTLRKRVVVFTVLAP